MFCYKFLVVFYFLLGFVFTSTYAKPTSNLSARAVEEDSFILETGKKPEDIGYASVDDDDDDDDSIKTTGCTVKCFTTKK
eukprot:Pgem_evm1s8055